MDRPIGGYALDLLKSPGEERVKSMYATRAISREEAGQIVRDAAKVIEEKGWAKGRLSMPTGEVCMRGAICLVLNGGLGLSEVPYSILLNTSERSYGVEAHFMKWLGPEEYSALVVPVWNDGEEQTKENVLLYMNKFADEVAPRAQ